VFHFVFPLRAVRALRLNAAAVGEPLVPGFLIRSPDPAAILARLARMLAYRPGFSDFIDLFLDLWVV